MDRFVELLAGLAPEGMTRDLILWLAVSYFVVTGYFHLRRAVRETLHDRSLLEREKARLEILRLKLEILRMGGMEEQAKLAQLVSEAFGSELIKQPSSVTQPMPSPSVPALLPSSPPGVSSTPSGASSDVTGVEARFIPAIIRHNPLVSLLLLVPLNAVSILLGTSSFAFSLLLVIASFDASYPGSVPFSLAAGSILMLFSAVCLRFTYRTISVWRTIRASGGLDRVSA